jgi:Bacterial SH3 domain
MKRVSAPGYDLFKLIVALILVLLLIIIILRGCNPAPPPSPVPEANTSSVTATKAPSLVPATEQPTLEPTITPTLAPTVAPPTVTETPVEPAAPVTPTPTTAPEPLNVSCNTSVPSRLQVGQNARTLKNLNMRTGPDIKASLIQTNLSGTQVEIIGGPECNPQGEPAYLWWQIRLANGMEGWSAESPLIQKSYFLEPIP